MSDYINDKYSELKVQLMSEDTTDNDNDTPPFFLCSFPLSVKNITLNNTNHFRQLLNLPRDMYNRVQEVMQRLPFYTKSGPFQLTNTLQPGR